jgi:hypothetical protein
MSTLSIATIKSQNTLPPAVQNSSGTEIGTFCRAWVNFNGTGTVAIRASFNVSSITDNGTGDYTVNFTTAMSDANYSAVTDGQIVSGVADITTQIAAAGFSTGSFRMISQNNSTNALTDSPLITASVFR